MILAAYPLGVGPLLVGAAGLLALGVAVAILRSFGPGYRVGRLLAVVPQIPIAEAVALAERGETRYVRVDGRIDSDAEFEDDAHRPLVFRRTRLQLRRGAGWSTFEDARQRVRFEVRDGLQGIVVDDAALDSGLVVVPRESVGTAADVADRVPPGTPADAVVRLRVDQVSSVEHATVLGVPTMDDAVEPRLTAGLGRPLILTTLERGEAMRMLTEGEARRPMIAAACLAAGLGLVLLAGVVAVVGAVS